ncbi:hypothetical protein C8R48DRAFT_680556, partial [Suillus tomentosus]
GPTVDVISENVNRPGAYADGLGNSDGWAQSSVFGPGKGNGRAQSPMGKITSGGISGKAIDGPRTCIFARENGGRWAESCHARYRQMSAMGPELNLISDNGRYTQLRWMGPDVDLTVQNVPNNDGCILSYDRHAVAPGPDRRPKTMEPEYLTHIGQRTGL